ncbi:Zinc finger, MYM-type 2 [Balamuthia mandrillaris]
MKGKKKEDEKQNKSLLRETERLQKKEEEIRAKARKKAERKQLDRLVDHVLDVYEKEKGQEKAKHHVQKLDVLFPGMGMTRGLSEEELQPKKVQLDTVMRKATREYRPDQQRKKSGSAILGKSRSRTTTSASPLPSRHSPHGRGRNEDERGGGRRRATTSTAPSAPFQPTKLSASASSSPTSPSSPLTSSARMSREKGAIVEPRKRDEEERRGEEEADEKRSTLRRHKSFSDVAETRTKDKLDIVSSPTSKQKEDKTAKETKKKEEKKKPKKKEKEKEEPKERRKKEAKKKTKKPEAEKKEDADHSFARTGGRHRSKTEASPPPPSFVAALAAEDVPSSRHSGSFLPLTPELDSTKQLKELSQADAPTASKSGSWITRRRSGSAIFRGMKTKKEAMAAKKDKKKKDKPAKKEKKKKGSSKREKEKEKGKENDKEVVLKVDISSSTSSFNSSLHHKNEEDTKENEQRPPHKANEEDVDEEEIDFILNGGRSGSGTGAEKSEKMIRDKLNRRKEDFWLDTDNLSSVAEISDPFHSDDDGINGTADLGEVECTIVTVD